MGGHKVGVSQESMGSWKRKEREKEEGQVDCIKQLKGDKN